jgi:hypothetical protein
MANTLLSLGSRTIPYALATTFFGKHPHNYYFFKKDSLSTAIQEYCLLKLNRTELLSEVAVEVKLRLTVSQPILLGVRHPFETRDQFFFLLEIFFRQLRACYIVAPSLTRGWACNVLLLLVLASAGLCRTQDNILLSQFLRLPQPGGPGPHIYIPQEQGGPDIPPGTGFELLSKSHYDRQSVGQPILVSGAHLDP